MRVFQMSMNHIVVRFSQTPVRRRGSVHPAMRGMGRRVRLVASLTAVATALFGSVASATHFGPGDIDVVPTGPSAPNLFPFGTNTANGGGFVGYIYRDLPPFVLTPGTRIAFDVGVVHNVDIRRNIYFSVANINPGATPILPTPFTDGVAATSWIQVVSDSAIPSSPKGNAVCGDYELVYTAEAPFVFPGGGLIVGFGGSPPGAYVHPWSGSFNPCLVKPQLDTSGFSYARFTAAPHLSLAVLDAKLDRGGMIGIVIEQTACGNGFVEAGEACDDGNTSDGDSCRADCSAVGAPTMTGWGMGSLMIVLVSGLTVLRRREAVRA